MQSSLIHRAVVVACVLGLLCGCSRAVKIQWVNNTGQELIVVIGSSRQPSAAIVIPAGSSGITHHADSYELRVGDRVWIHDSFATPQMYASKARPGLFSVRVETNGILKYLPPTPSAVPVGSSKEPAGFPRSPKYSRPTK